MKSNSKWTQIRELEERIVLYGFDRSLEDISDSDQRYSDHHPCNKVFRAIKIKDQTKLVKICEKSNEKMKTLLANFFEFLNKEEERADLSKLTYIEQARELLKEGLSWAHSWNSLELLPFQKFADEFLQQAKFFEEKARKADSARKSTDSCTSSSNEKTFTSERNVEQEKEKFSFKENIRKALFTDLGVESDKKKEIAEGKILPDIPCPSTNSNQVKESDHFKLFSTQSDDEISMNSSPKDVSDRGCFEDLLNRQVKRKSTFIENPDEETSSFPPLEESKSPLLYSLQRFGKSIKNFLDRHSRKKLPKSY